MKHTCGIDGKKNGPRDYRTNKTNDKENLEQAEEKEVVERRVAEDVAVVEALVVLDPAKSTVGGFGCFLVLIQERNV